MKKKLLIVAVVLAALLVLAIPAGYFTLFQMASVPTGSMANTIIPGDVVAGVRFFGEIKRGDIFIFKLPHDPKVNYIKRVIGLPGDEILLRGTDVLVNGQLLPEQKVRISLIDSANEGLIKELRAEPAPTGAKWKVYYDEREESGGEEADTHITHGMKYGVGKPFRVPAGHYFVMGDCRDNALDSRYWGTVPAANFVARVFMIVDSYATDPNTHTRRQRENRWLIPLE